MGEMSLARDARLWLRAHRYGLLSTHSRAVAGYPFGSVVPYVLDHEACPLLLISRLAEHTKNLAGDARVSLLIHEPGEDAASVQAQARVTLMGQAERIENPEQIEPRYERYFPATRGYRTQLDFEFWRIVPVTLRAIAGFAKVHWVSREAYAPPPNTLAADEANILEHMNTDHAHTMIDYCRLQNRRYVKTAEMIGIDCDGFDLNADGKSLRFNFDEPVTSATAIREALITLAQKARAA
jgi:putative heme iron utilization protein